MLRAVARRLAAGLILLLLAQAAFAAGPGRHPEAPAGEPIPVPNPSADLWRTVRDRTSPGAVDPNIRNLPAPALARDLWLDVVSGQKNIAGNTQARGTDAGVLINTEGEQWRNYRMTQFVPIAGYVLGGIIVVLALFRVVRGKIPIRDGRSNRRLPRYSVAQRTAHWSVAITFIILGVTGCVLAFGRSLLIPVLGPQAFSYLAIASKRIHDFVGPVFGVSLVFMFFLFLRGNGPRLKEDIMWFIKGGGLLGPHASSGRYNAGEKGWFWLAALGGLIVVATGLVLDFPIFGQDRLMMSLAHVAHSAGSIILIAAALAHIYMGTVAMEGAFEVMSSGYCDSNWAKEHHDLWYEEVADQAEPYPPTTAPRAASAAGEQAASGV